MTHINPSIYVSAKVRSFYIKGASTNVIHFHLKIVEEIHVLWTTYKE